MGPVGKLSLELTACRIDIITACFPGDGHDVLRQQYISESINDVLV